MDVSENINLIRRKENVKGSAFFEPRIKNNYSDVVLTSRLSSIKAKIVFFLILVNISILLEDKKMLKAMHFFNLELETIIEM